MNAAPTIIAAIVRDNAPSVLETQWSEPVLATSLVGLALPFTTGTPRTLAGIASGLGTGTLLFGLSGALSRGDVATFNVQPGNAITDTAGEPAPVQQALVQNYVGGIAPANLDPKLVRITHASIATVLLVGQTALVDTSGGAPPTITMPPSPVDEDLVEIVDVVGVGGFGTTPCVVTANAGQTIEDPSQAPGTYGATATLAQDSETLAYRYNASLSRWKIR
jgi:hypothetical protein